MAEVDPLDQAIKAAQQPQVVSSGAAKVPLRDDQIQPAIEELVNLGHSPKKAKFIVDASRDNGLPLLKYLTEHTAGVKKEDPYLLQSQLVRDNPEDADLIRKFGPSGAAKVRDKLIEREFKTTGAKNFTLDRSKMSPEDQAATANLSDTDASQYFKERLGRSEKTARASQMVDSLKVKFPQYADQLEALRDQPEALSNVISSLYSKQFDDPKEQKFRVDRSHLPPGLAKYAPYMSDEQIGQIASKEYAAQSERGGNPPGFKGLTIVQDDKFKRSGLKTGDTVCIKIP